MVKSRKQLNLFKKNRNRDLAKANSARIKKADDRAIRLVPALMEIYRKETSERKTLKYVGRELNLRDERLPRGQHIWTSKDVSLLLDRVFALPLDVLSDVKKEELRSLIGT